MREITTKLGMQNRGAVLIAAAIFLSLTAGRALADWKNEWDRIVEAAKREGAA